MKLLLDENLAPRLAARLQDVFPESLHVRDAGLASASDLEVWNHAKERGFASSRRIPTSSSRASCMGIRRR